MGGVYVHAPFSFVSGHNHSCFICFMLFIMFSKFQNLTKREIKHSRHIQTKLSVKCVSISGFYYTHCISLKLIIKSLHAIILFGAFASCITVGPWGAGRAQLAGPVLELGCRGDRPPARHCTNSAHVHDAWFTICMCMFFFSA